MKYIDRLSLGIERFFEDKSQIISNLREYSPSEISLRLESAPFRVRFSVAHIVSDAISQLLRSGAEVRSRIPDEVADLSQIGGTVESVSVNRLIPFFEWLTDIYRNNEQGHVNWLAATRDAAFRMDKVTGDFLVSFASLINQRVVLKKQGDGIVMVTAEREWGMVKMFFPHTQLSIPELDFPIMGYLFCLETDALNDNEFELRMMIDTEFSDEPYVGRMLQERDWLSFSFSSGRPVIELVEYNYVDRLRLAGTSRSETITAVSSLLLSKLTMIGSEGLSAGEREMVPLAKLLHGATGLVTEDDEAVIERCEELVSSVLENRYALSGIRSMLVNCDCSRLVKHLDAAGEYFYNEETDKALKEIERFAAVYIDQIESGTARRLLYKIEERFVNMMPENHSTSIYNITENAIAKRVNEVVSAPLEKIGFKGEYPHFSRSSEESLEYLSFVMRSDNFRTKRGEITYNITLAAGKTLSGISTKFSPLGVPIDAPNALDCMPEKSLTSKYGELGGDFDDYRVNIVANVFCDEIIVSDESENLCDLIKIANESFSGRALPTQFREHRKAVIKPLQVIFKSLIDNIHYGVMTAVFLLLVYTLFGQGVVGITAAIIIAFSVVFLIPFVIALCYYMLHYKHMWRF